MVDFEWGSKILLSSYEFGTTLKHLETINGNVKNLSKMMRIKDKKR